jgi:hypothetical protein
MSNKYKYLSAFYYYHNAFAMRLCSKICDSLEEGMGQEGFR